MSDIELGQRIKTVRKKIGLTQAAVAKEFGCTQSLVSSMETGDSPPSMNFLYWLHEKEKNLSFDWLLTGKNKLEDETLTDSNQHIPPSNISLIKQVIEAVMEHLQNNKLTMPPATIADVVEVLYEEITESGASQVNKGTVARLIKLAM